MSINYANIHFDRYLSLVRALYPQIRGLIAFDRAANPVWQENDSSIDEQQLHSLLSDFSQAAVDSQTHEMNNGECLELVKLRDGQLEPVLMLCLCSATDRETAPGELAGQRDFADLNAMLLADFCRNLELADRDNRLNQVSEELARRQEELNLIYKSEDRAADIHHGRELLRQLVSNTSTYLKVDVIFLYIVGRKISMHRYRNNDAVFHADILFNCLRETVYPWLQEKSLPLVVNNAEERQKLGVAAELPFKFVASPVANADGETIGLLATASQENLAGDFSANDRNLLEVMAKKASRISQSHFDPLTGLENSHSFELILRDLLRHSRERDTQHAIANIDIDRLAVVNDISGRDAGNHLIKVIADKLVDTVRPYDLVARLGSDKFGILLKNCDLKTAEVIMKKASHAISSLDVEWQGKRHEPSVSIGLAAITEQTLSVTGLLEAAETARDVSKQRGRNSIHVLDLEDSNLLRRKEQIRWVGRIQDGLRDNRFRLFAQPIAPLRAQQGPPHFEILLRFQQEDGRIMDPGDFLAAAESFYLMASLDLWVINQAFYELKQMFPDADEPGCHLSINLSGQSLNDPYTLASYIENKLEEYELDGKSICFEITESTAIANLEEAALFIEHIRDLGCKFSLDDFGTGLSSFSYLKNLNVDYLKIDGSFVRDIVQDPVSESMVAAINQVGQAMNLETIGEYVENDEVRQKLVSMGVDYAQGYGIGKPMPFHLVQDDLAQSA